MSWKLYSLRYYSRVTVWQCNWWWSLTAYWWYICKCKRPYDALPCYRCNCLMVWGGRIWGNMREESWLNRNDFDETTDYEDFSNKKHHYNQSSHSPSVWFTIWIFEQFFLPSFPKSLPNFARYALKSKINSHFQLVQ